MNPSGSAVYQVKDLEGCQVMTCAGELLGRLADVLPSGGNDILVVRQDRREILIPALKDVVRQIDLAGRRIQVELPRGLREIYENKPTAAT